MGLDNIWVNQHDAEWRLHFAPELMLVGGLMSGHGNGSFRGKVYADLVEAVTGVSLYTDRIPPATVRTMADKLATVTPEWAGDTYGLPKQQVEDLQRMFVAYAEAGAALLGWW